MLDFLWRQAGELTYPSKCLLCTSDTLPLLDTHQDTVGEMRVYLCQRCVGKVLAAVDVVAKDDHLKTASDLAAVAIQLGVAKVALDDERESNRGLLERNRELEDRLAEMSSERAAHIEGFHAMRQELAERRANGGRTQAEAKAVLTADAIVKTKQRKARAA